MTRAWRCRGRGDARAAAGRAGGARARLQAAERGIETLIVPRRAVLTSEARVAEVDAGLARLAADLLVEQAKLA